MELCNMIIECCSQERTYEKFFGLIGERLSKINLVWAKSFEQCFVQYYETIHRYETNRLRNVSKYFGHLLSSDAISWEVFSVIKDVQSILIRFLTYSFHIDELNRLRNVSKYF